MHWKKYKGLPPEEKRGEAYYILGLDIGNDSSGIAFYNIAAAAPEVIDLSGGYGRPSIPTVMQYIAETKEWVFGEYALLNRGAGAEVTLSGLVARLGQNEYMEIDRRPVSLAAVLALFIQELVGSVKSINPRAQVAGMVASVPSYFSDQARAELTRAFTLAGYEKELIALVPDRECVFTRFYADRLPVEEHVLLIDYGSREVRGGLYHMKPQGASVIAESLSSLFDDQIGTAMVNGSVAGLFTQMHRSNARAAPDAQTAEHIQTFAYQHRDLLFQKNIRQKPVKLYFNFAYPPFQVTVTQAQADALTEPFLRQFRRFARELTEKNLYGVQELTPEDVNQVLCVGGGFEMLWVREAAADLFPRAALKVYKNTKAVTAEGAALLAAMYLDAADAPTVRVEDKHQLTADIGLCAGEGRFLPLAERSAFWWQRHPARFILVRDAVADALPVTLAVRSAAGDIAPLSEVTLTGLPRRPKGVTRFSAQAAFSSHSDLTVRFADLGFGEMFPRTEFEQTVALSLG